MSNDRKCWLIEEFSIGRNGEKWGGEKESYSFEDQGQESNKD